MTAGNPRSLAAPFADVRFEVLPVEGIDSDVVGALPPGSTVTVTCSPQRGLDRTIEVTERLRTHGFDAVPHLAARQVRGDVHLKEVVERLDRAGVRDVFVVGGDAPEHGGPFATGLELLEALSGLDHPFDRLGVPGYPEGHHLADDETMMRALLAKQRHATYMVTQLCFDAGAICRWLADARDRGVELPCHVGVAGAVDAGKLLRMSMRIGIGDSVRFLRGNRATALRLLRAGGYRADSLLRQLGEGLADGRCRDVAGLHVYTFNQVERSARWAGRFTRAGRYGRSRPRAPLGGSARRRRR
jgi:methylenetetrahydrofolate reductase (NADPH)